ncbi:MAG: hypothetical protein ACRCZE_03275 [Candidatus Altimarinota bacterium]
MENSQQIINSLEQQNDLLQEQLKLSQEQNNLLQQLLKFHQDQEKSHHREQLIRFILTAIPYLALVILGYYLFSLFFQYLEILNNNINLLKDGYLNIQEQITKLIPDFSGIKEGISNTWQNVKDIF